MQGYSTEYKTQDQKPMPGVERMDAAWFYVLQFNGSARSDRMTDDYRAALDRLVTAGVVAAEQIAPEVFRYSLPAGSMPSEAQAQEEANAAAYGQDEDEAGLVDLLAAEEEARTGWASLATYGPLSDF